MTIPYTFTYKGSHYEMSFGMQISNSRKKVEIAKWLRSKRKPFVKIRRKEDTFEVELVTGRKLILKEI